MAGCIVSAVIWAIYPFVRAAFRLQVGYNEGWNIYSTQRLVDHLPLYPQAYGWQTVNYPMLSFAWMAFLHRFTHEYLFTARFLSLVSLLTCCILCGVAVRQLAGTSRAAILSSFFCLAIFCTDADLYVGMDDPQLLAHAFFLTAFVIYLKNRRSWRTLLVASACSVLAGSIKHNAVDFPLAILCDLAFLSWQPALWFAACSAAFAVLSLALNLHFGGPYFLTQLLAPRTYDFQHGFYAVTLGVLLPLIVPLALVLAFAWTMRNDPLRRILALLLALSLLIGTFFAGGSGVSTNTYFSAIFAIVMLTGVFLSELEKGEVPWIKLPFARSIPGLLFLWLLVPAGCNDVVNPIAKLQQTAERQRHFDQEVSFLKQHPSPQICEDLLLCFYAGQPYLYDPFNATRLLHFNKLDPQLFLKKLDNGEFGVVELEQHEPEDTSQQDRFPKSFLNAITEHYKPVLTTPDAVFYLPKSPRPPARVAP